MFKALQGNKIIAISDTDSEFKCLVKTGVEQDKTHTCEDYEQYNGEYLLKQDVPLDYQNEQIRQQRQARYVEESDPLKYDYEEACARYGQDSDEAQDAKVIWLQKKDEIRERYPYEN